MAKQAYKLFVGAEVNGVTIGVYSRQSCPGDDKLWYLTDFVVKHGERVVSEHLRCGACWGHIMTEWQKLCRFQSLGYPVLAHTPTGGSPHYVDKAGGVYYAPFTGLTDPTLYKPMTLDWQKQLATKL